MRCPRSSGCWRHTASAVISHHRYRANGRYPFRIGATGDAIEAAERNQQGFDRSGDLRARPLGIHLEGPFISHSRRGVHPPENLLIPSVAAFDRFWQAARGHIRVLTIAPELAGAVEVIAEASARGVCVSLGHSDADLSAARAGFAAAPAMRLTPLTPCARWTIAIPES